MNKNDCLQGIMSDCVNTHLEEHGICESYWMDGNLTYLDSGTDKALRARVCDQGEREI